jgi:hypothetical protein
LVPTQIIGPIGFHTISGNLDPGSDDTVLPASLASRIGIDLTSAPQGQSGGVGGAPVTYRYATVTLRLSDGYEEFEWTTIVGFFSGTMRWAVLGHAGVLQFFDVQFLGARREVVIAPNASFPGRHSVYRQAPP